MATNSTPLSQLTSNNSYNNDKINQSVKKDNNGLTSADLLNCNKVEIKGDQPLKNNIISNYTDVSAVPSIDLNLMNKMSVINNIQGLNESKINNENITNSYNINPLTNEKLNQLLMTVALNNNVDIDKMVNYTSSNNIIMNTMTGRNETNNENIDLNNNTNNNHNKNLDNGNNINNNDSNLSNSYLNQEFLLQLLQQQQQLQQQLYILQQQQLHKNNEVNHDINIIPNQKKDINSFAYNNTNNSPSLLYSSNGLEVKENNQDFYQYFSQMSDSSTSKINSSSISIPSYTLPVSSRPMSTSSHTTYSLNPKIMSFPVSVNPNFNERNNDLINYEKQEFTKPPKVPSHLISSSLTNNGINNYNNGNDGKANEYLDEKKKLKDFQSKSMSPIIATVAPMTISNSNNDPIININLSLQENSYLKKDDLDVSKNKSLSNSSSTSLSSTTTLENDKNALDSSGTTFLLNEESNIIQRKNSKNSSTTSSNSTLTLFPNANNESDSKNSNNFKQSKISNNSETDIDNKIESIKVIEGTSSVSTPKLINSTSESKNNDNNNTLLSTKNISESIEALKLNDSQEIISKTDSSDNLGTTPNASSSNKYLSAISSVSNDDQRSSIIGSNDKTTELPILRIGQPISDLSNGGLMVNSGNVNANGISNSFSDGFDLLNIPNYRLSYLSSRDFSNNLNNITNNELLSVNNSINSNRLSDNNNLNNTNDKKEIDFLSFNLSIENPSSSLSDNKNLFPPSAAIPIYKNNKNLNSSNNSNNINNSLLNDGSLNGFFSIFSRFFTFR
ncbi:hypothetical protein BCR36DRAFT_135935 [Piromyces finnis]|uniref:Uncharacterized protein n=1 Tax=Piromyces finnis TaxID=1754191 RepID=A0A1Y1VJ57_9FUNG|nr:hypothetical protein BCR36DRAFT_135935 [Piromyces finnis]|eukprot:ORX57753.1 hypothetical protein BCR36DRAFT_135935 [Piromyces finnis]